MDFFIETAAGERIEFTRPERARLSLGAQTTTFNILDLGEVVIPRGIKSARISWDATFFGDARARSVVGQVFDISNNAFLTAPLPIRELITWRPPLEFEGILGGLLSTGEFVRLVITESTIDLTVLVSQFDTTYGISFLRTHV